MFKIAHARNHNLSALSQRHTSVRRHALRLLLPFIAASVLTTGVEAQQQPAAQIVHAQLAKDVSALAPVTLNGERKVASTDRAITLEANGVASGLDYLSGTHDLERGNDRVLIQLSQPPLLAMSARAASGVMQATRSTTTSHAAALANEHREARAAITSAIASAQAQASSSPKAAAPTIVREFSAAFNGFAVRGISVAAAQKAFAGMRGVTIHPDVTVRASLKESVDIIRASEVWRPAQGLGLDGTGITIGIIDTGVDYTHPDLGGCLGSGCKVAGGYDFVNNDQDPMDDHGHGTHVAATAAGNGSYRDGNGVTQPLPGVAPGALIYGYKVLSAGGWGSGSDIIAAIERCADPNEDGNPDDHLHVCSLSLGGGGDPDDPMSRAIDIASANGVVFTVAAGNSGPAAGTVGSPGTSREAITVAASCKPGSSNGNCVGSPIARFSSRGPIPNFPEVHKPDVAAPGVAICAARFGSYAAGSECKDSTHIAISGTSMATPHVAGLAAIIRQANPDLTPAEVKAILIGTATDLGQDATAQGAGLVDAVAAVGAAGQPQTFLRFQGGAPLLRYTPSLLVQSFSTSMTIVNTSGNPLAVSPSVPSAPPGVAISFPSGSFTLPTNGRLTVPITVSVDHSTAVAQQLAVPLELATPLGTATISMVLEIGSPLTLSAAKLDLGVASPSDDSFAVTRELTLTNSLLDAPLTLSASTSAWTSEGGAPSRYASALSATSLSVPAGGSLTISVDTSVLSPIGLNGPNASLLSISGSGLSVTLPMSLWQGYALNLSYGATTPRFVQLGSHDAANGSSAGEHAAFWPELNSSASRILMRTAGGWDVSALFYNDSSEALVIKTLSISSAETSLEIAQREATVKVVGKIPAASGLFFYAWSFAPQHGGRELASDGLILDWRGSSDFSMMINPLSADWRFSAMAGIMPLFQGDSSKAPVLLHFYHEGGISSDLVMDPGPLRPYHVNAVSQASPNSTPTFTLQSGIKRFLLDGSLDGLWYINTVTSIPAGDSLLILGSGYHSSPLGQSSPADLPFSSIFIGNSASAELVSSAVTFSSSGALAYDEDRFFHLAHTEDWAHPYVYGPTGYLGPRLHPLERPDVITVGVGPLFDRSRWYNVGPSSATLVPRAGALSSFFSYGGTSKARGFLATSGSDFVEPAPEYTLELNGSPIASGQIGERWICPPHRPWTCISFGSLAHQLTVPTVAGIVPEGRYAFSMARSATILGVQTQVSTSSEFSISSEAQHASAPIDENPPSLLELHVQAGGLRQSSIDPTVTNTITLSLDPNPGLGELASVPGELHHAQLPDSLTDVHLYQSENGVAWQELPLQPQADGRFSSQVSVRPGAALYHFRIEAADSADNRLSHSFSLPAAPARTLRNPISSPLRVSLEGLSSNRAYSPSAKVEVTVLGQNVILGSKVEIVANDTVIQLTNFAPSDSASMVYRGLLSFSQLPQGKVSLHARITDFAGRQANSSPQIVTINASGGGDGASLSLSIDKAKRLRVGSSMSFSIKASGIRPSEIRNVAVMANGKPACRFSSAPYTCSWRVPRTPRYSLRLRARATDSNGALIRSRITTLRVTP